MEKKNLTLTQKFDLAKKLAEGGTGDGYTFNGQEPWQAYLTREEWKAFMKSMPEDVRVSYSQGGGSELQEKTRNGVNYPPKMASYGSSSRFMYLQGKDIQGFVFEKKFPTGFRGSANMDGYLQSKNIFVEAKCHEIYTSASKELKAPHVMLCGYLKETLPDVFSFKQIGDERYEVTIKDHTISHFDMKQLLCHFAGIARYCLENGCDNANFVYLIYKPTKQLLDYIDSKRSRNSIRSHYEQELKEAEIVKQYANLIIDKVLQYQRKIKGYGRKSSHAIDLKEFRLSFTICSQEDFNTVVSQLQDGD